MPLLLITQRVLVHPWDCAVDVAALNFCFETPVGAVSRHLGQEPAADGVPSSRLWVKGSNFAGHKARE